MKQGNYAVIIPHIRKVIDPLLKSCVRCIRNAKNIQTFQPPIGNPRFLSLLESSSPIFLGISMDAIGPVKFLLKRGARGANSVSKGYVLIIVCVLTKYLTFYLMEDCQKVDLELAVSTHIAKFRTPKFVLSDAGSSNDLLNGHQQSILEVLQSKTRLEILQSSHQFLNICESQIKIFKAMLRSINHGVPSSAPLNTRAELNCIFSHICNVLNSRPLSTQHDSTLVLNSNMLVKPFISNVDQELLMGKFLQEIFNEQDKHELFSKIFKNNSEMAQSASILLKREFLSNSKMFTDKDHGLEPLAGDVVVICKEEPRIGLIIEVISKHRVRIRLKSRGKNVEDTYHVKTLGLIFRPATSVHFLATIDKDQNQTLNPLLSSFWRKLGGSLRHGSLDLNTSTPSPPTG